MVSILRLTGTQKNTLHDHLIPGDGKEAAALLFCVKVERAKTSIFLVKEVRLIAHDECISRTPFEVVWPTEKHLLPEIQRIEKDSLCIFTIHSHPNGYLDFSAQDDVADTRILGSLYNCVDGTPIHGSVIMFPNGSLKARVMHKDGNFELIDRIMIVGDRINFIDCGSVNATQLTDYQKKTEQVLGKGTLRLLKSLKIGVVGCSGTGSPTIEMLMRHSAGTLVLVDFDIIKNGNLNRMIMSRVIDVSKHVPKVQRYKDWAQESGLETEIIPVQEKLEAHKAIIELSSCDIIFGCVDNVESRHFLNMLCSAYLIPYFDLGVGIVLDKKNIGGITHAIARAHYMQPDKSGLLDRGAFTPEALVAEEYKRSNPELYKEQVNAGYLGEINEDQPAVMALTVDAAVMGIQDMLARLQGFRVGQDKDFEMQEKSLTHGYYKNRAQPGDAKALKRFFAIGDRLLERS